MTEKVPNINQTREKIVTIATKLFYLKGYHATGLSQILKESGAPKGSLYYHFPEGKEQLAIETVMISKNTVGDKIQYFLQQHKNPVDAVQAHIQMMAQLFESEFGIQNDSFAVVPFGLMAAESAFENENLGKACEDAFQYWENMYRDKLLASGYDAEQSSLISTTLTALIEGAVTLSLTQKSSKPLVRINQMIPSLMNKN